MRWMVAALALGALAACDASINTDGDLAGGPAEGYTMEIRASSLEQTYLIIAPGGETVGARSAEGASALMDGDRARALVAEAPPQGEEAPQVMSLRVPGFEMSINANEENAEGEQGQVRMSIGDGAQRITVNADEGGPGDEDDRAYVRITGADAAAVREFIAEADELSPSVQAEMLAALGLQ